MDDRIIYVGSGRGPRALSHIRMTKSLKDSKNCRDCVNRAWATRRMVSIRIFFAAKEEASRALESAAINFYKPLCNKVRPRSLHTPEVNSFLVSHFNGPKSGRE